MTQARERSAVPAGAIGSATWPGLSKSTEEAGELLQVLGKLLAYPSGEHPDGAGDTTTRLAEEVADVQAALSYLVWANDALDEQWIEGRRRTKFHRFRSWHHRERGL